MKAYVALLRGINVGGHKLIKMELLRQKLARVELSDIKTYIQSGNIVFKSEIEEVRIIEQIIVSAIVEEFGFEVPVFVREVSYFEKLLAENPFCNNNIETSTLHITFLSESTNSPHISDENKGDTYKIIEDKAYLCLQNKYHETKYSNSYFEKLYKSNATTRNWKTIQEIVKLTKESN